jgi:hypothetical protein
MAGKLDQTENAIHPAIAAVMDVHHRRRYGCHTP